MFSRKLLEKEFRKELESSILLEERAKSTLLRKISIWPDLLLERALIALRSKNKKVENYIDAALETDKSVRYFEKLRKLSHG